MSSHRLHAQRVLATAMAAVMLSSLAPVAHADDPNDRKHSIDSRINQTQDDLDLVSAKLKAANDTLAKTDAAVAKAGADKKAKDTAYEQAVSHQREVAGDLKAAQADEAKADQTLKVNDAAQQQTKRLVGAVARHSYETGGLGKFELTLQILMTRTDPTDQLALADIVMRRQGVVLADLSSEKAVAEATQARLAATRRRIAGLKVTADAAAAAAKQRLHDATEAQARLVAIQKTQRDDKAALDAQKKADLAQLAKDKAESADLAKLIKARADAAAKAAHRPPVGAPPKQLPSAGGGGGGFISAPGPIGSIVSGFGMRVNPVLGVSMLHAGDDFPFACGTPVYAAAAGVIAAERSDSVGGNNITIDHGFARGVYVSSYYAHLSRFVARSGQHVKKGQLIGISGTTGRSTGCHLHFGILENGTWVNPLRWIG